MSSYDHYGLGDLETVRRLPGMIDFTCPQSVARIEAWIKNHASDRAQRAAKRPLEPAGSQSDKKAALDALRRAVHGAKPR